MEYKNIQDILYTYLQQCLNNAGRKLNKDSQGEGKSFAYLDHDTLQIILISMLIQLQTPQKEKEEGGDVRHDWELQTILNQLEEIVEDNHSEFKEIIQLIEK